MKILAGVVLAAFIAIPDVHADVLADIKPLQQRWAEVNYQLDQDKREQAFADLLTQADAVVAANADKAEAYIWRGIITSSYAGAKGGIGA